MSHNASPQNNSQQNTPPEDIFPVFQYDNPPPPTPPEVMFPPQNTQPEDIFPVFQYDNPPPPTPPEVMFPPPNNQQPNNQPANQPIIRQLTEQEQYELDMEVLREYEAEQARQEREREVYLKGKQDRRNRRAEWRWAQGLPPVPSSEDDSSASYSSHEGYVSDDSFY